MWHGNWEKWLLHFVDPVHSSCSGEWRIVSDKQRHRESHRLPADTRWLPTDVALPHSAPPKENKQKSENEWLDDKRKPEKVMLFACEVCVPLLTWRWVYGHSWSVDCSRFVTLSAPGCSLPREWVKCFSQLQGTLAEDFIKAYKTHKNDPLLSWLPFFVCRVA